MLCRIFFTVAYAERQVRCIIFTTLPLPKWVRAVVDDAVLGADEFAVTFDEFAIALRTTTLCHLNDTAPLLSCRIQRVTDYPRELLPERVRELVNTAGLVHTDRPHVDVVRVRERARDAFEEELEPWLVGDVISHVLSFERHYPPSSLSDPTDVVTLPPIQ